MALPDISPARRGSISSFHRRSRHLAAVPDLKKVPGDSHGDADDAISRPSLRLVVNNAMPSANSSSEVLPSKSHKGRRAGFLTALGTVAAVSVAACGSAGSAARPDSRPITDVGRARGAITLKVEGIARDIISLAEQAKAHPKDGMRGNVQPFSQQGRVPIKVYTFSRLDPDGHFCKAQIEVVVDSHGNPDFGWKQEGNTSIGLVDIKTGTKGHHPYTHITTDSWSTNPYLSDKANDYSQNNPFGKATPQKYLYVMKPRPKSGERAITPANLSTVYSDMNSNFQLYCNPANSNLTP